MSRHPEPRAIGCKGLVMDRFLVGSLAEPKRAVWAMEYDAKRRGHKMSRIGKKKVERNQATLGELLCRPHSPLIILSPTDS